MPDKRKYADRREELILAVAKRRRKIKLMAIEYKGGKCQICNYNKYQGGLDLHHVNPKTKEFARAMACFKTGKDSVLCVIDAVTENIKRSTKNIPRLNVIDPGTLNALDVVNVRKILMSRDSLKIITKRLKNV